MFDGAGRVIATASDFPGSTGRYRGQYMVYDIMGRMSRRSNPTEMTNQWLAAGDDAQAGWLYTDQTYDWKGRPRIATNTDQTTTEMSYGGCGCAGGEVVTVRDEMNRRERMTYDVVGRLAKTEILNWNQSVYSTTKTTYNARDQVTLVRQYQGTETSTTFQDTLMTYDGHARLLTRKLPAESSPTSFQYYADDQLHVRTDPRGATSTFTYNSRHLATSITYAKPGNAPEPDPAFPNAPQVGFDYDSAGNRLWMTDGQGRVDYLYDTWSRLTSETRFLQDLGSSFALTYQYNLAGQLTRVTEPFGSVVNYGYDSAGQMTSATGSGPASAPVYISQMGYRAWGAPKQVTYGNGKNLSVGYNNRLKVTSFSIPGLMGATLAYYADGRAHTAQASSERRFDRAYTYDHAGRMTNAVSGYEAGIGSTEVGPYRQSYGYDAFSNMTLRTGLLWSGFEDGYSTTYVNDRNQAWSYNEAGLPNTQETLTAIYNSAGLRHQTVSPNRHVGNKVVNMTLDQRHDGDGLLIKETTTMVGSTTTYNLRSSVLGGQVIADITSSGTRRVGYVYANGQLIARQYPFSGVQWDHRDPMNTRVRHTSSTGANLGGAEYDPTHSSVGLEDPGPAPDGDGTLPDLLYPKGGDPTDLSGGCMLDFMVVPCSVAMSVVNMEAGVETDPYASPSLRWNEKLNSGQGAFEVFHAKADGFVGYGEIGTRYAGNGVFRNRPVLLRRGGNDHRLPASRTQFLAPTVSLFPVRSRRTGRRT